MKLRTLSTATAVLATLLGSAPAAAQMRRDLFVATKSTTTPSDFDVSLWSAVAPSTTFTVSLPFASAPGVATAIEPMDRRDGRVLVSADIQTSGGNQSVIYQFGSPFLVPPDIAPPVPTIVFQAPAGDRITDFKFDTSALGNPNGGMSMVVTGHNAAQTVAWLKRVPLDGRPILTFSVSALAPPVWWVAVDPATSDIHVVSDRGVLFEFDAMLQPVGGNVINPAVFATDVMWDPAVNSGSLVVSGWAPGQLNGLFRVTTGSAPQSTFDTTHPYVPPQVVTVDSTGNGFFLENSILNPRGVFLWDSAQHTTAQISPAVQNIQTMSWTGRAASGNFGTIPGTALVSSGLKQAALVGDAGLSYDVTSTSGITLGPISIMLSSASTAGIFLGPNGELLVDPTAPGFSLVPLPGAAPPSVFFSAPLTASMDGMNLFTQFLTSDPASGSILTSNATKLTIGQKPVD